MPALFNQRRPLSKAQYARRRDETTKEELNKLMASGAYRQWAKDKANDSCKPSAVPLLVAAAVAAVILGCILGVSMTSGKAELAPQAVQVNNPVPVVVQEEVCLPDEQPELDGEIADLTNQLKMAHAALDTATRANQDLRQSLKHAQNTPTECSLTKPSFMIGTHGPFTIPDLGIFGLDWAHAGLGAAFIAIIFASAISSYRASKRVAAAKAEASSLNEEMRELAFEKDTAEQSVAILEMELQRKVKQLAEAQAQHQVSTPTPTSPRIRAIKAAPTPQPSRIPTSPGSDALPPPPRQLVELWLQQRNAIAVENDQIQTWLELEETCERLQAEVERLRTEIEGRDADCSELTEHVHELVEELEEQRRLTLAAKTALKAVRSAGGIVSDEESDSELYEDSASTQ